MKKILLIILLLCTPLLAGSGFFGGGGCSVNCTFTGTTTLGVVSESGNFTLLKTGSAVISDLVNQVSGTNSNARLSVCNSNADSYGAVVLFSDTTAGGGTGIHRYSSCLSGGNALMTWSTPTSDVSFAANLLLGVNGITARTHLTTENCSSSASPAVCTTAAAGSVVVAAAASTVVVNTTAVTANSQIFVMYDSSLGTKLSVTCNVTEPGLYGVTARSATTSFTITATAPITNPACFSYFIVN